MIDPWDIIGWGIIALALATAALFVIGFIYGAVTGRDRWP